MDAFYEESSVAHDSKKGARRYKILNIVANVFLALGIFCLMLVLNIPTSLLVLWALVLIWLFSTWFVLFKMKGRFNVSYDYCFVSGELRIARVMNVNKRKPVAKFDCADIVQVGDVENSSFERLSADPNTKTVMCTSNDEPADDKFFMYILVSNSDGKKLYVLECREQLLVEMMKFLKRTVLESDYVAQEKKKNKI